MRRWRILTAAVAVILAVLAATLSYRYLSRADERAREGVELVEALVAKDDIRRGTTGREALDADLFETREVPRNAVPEMARRSIEGVAGLVASADVSQGQFIVNDTFVEPSGLGGLSSALSAGMQAISVTVDAMHGVAGFVVPGDTVSVMVTTEVEDLIAVSEASAAARIPPLTTTAFLVPGVKVLAVGATTVAAPAAGTAGDRAASTPAPSTSLTLEVTPREALQVAHAMQGAGQVYLSLNPPGFDGEDLTIPTEIVESYNWFDQVLAGLDDVRAGLGAASAELPAG